ncbi:MAG: hypothetical protein U9P38_08980 [Campylobacterota bacterium]|nr:hypothetical protein [Campylobacterota bacterium]
MEISTSSNIITITGNIKSVKDFQEIKMTADSMKVDNKSITVNIIDSLSITSSVIGYFNKLILKDKINIQMNIGNAKLLDLLGDLNLKSVFKAKKA